MSAPSATPRPPKAPAFTSKPSTPGPQPPGGYPRNSVVFATNQWDNSAAKGKRGLLAGTKAAVASYFPSTQSTSATDPDAPVRRNSVGHTPGIALRPGSNSRISDLSTHARADSDSSRGTLTPTAGDFPTPGGRTFASHLNPNSNLNSTDVQSDASEDYFGAATAAPSPVQGDKVPDPASIPGTEAHDDGPNPPPPSASIESTTLATPISPVSSSSTSPGAYSNFGSALSTNTPSTAPSSTVSSPRSLKSRPGVTYSPSTADARPVVSKAGSALMNVHRRVGSLSLSRATGSGNDTGNGKRLGFASLRRKGDGPAHARRASLDEPSQAEGRASTTTSTSPSPPSPSSTSASARANVGAVPSASKPSRRASIMRTLRGEATVLAGRVRGDKERVDRGRRIRAGEI
ncbi:hypothetical protein B0H12DRAFT_1103098 [Mycena haematopus]|nr:hypothetical protein B0H12DRAFT_1103098 [Mycena haematopus]